MSKAWPFGPWPEGPSDVNPPQEMITAAAEEMRREILQFMSIGLVVGGVFVLVGILVAAAFMLG